MVNCANMSSQVITKHRTKFYFGFWCLNKVIIIIIIKVDYKRSENVRENVSFGIVSYKHIIQYGAECSHCVGGLS